VKSLLAIVSIWATVGIVIVLLYPAVTGAAFDRHATNTSIFRKQNRDRQGAG
jgi:hypothetical protein